MLLRGVIERQKRIFTQVCIYATHFITRRRHSIPTPSTTFNRKSRKSHVTSGQKSTYRIFREKSQQKKSLRISCTTCVPSFIQIVWLVFEISAAGITFSSIILAYYEMINFRHYLTFSAKLLSWWLPYFGSFRTPSGRRTFFNLNKSFQFQAFIDFCWLLCVRGSHRIYIISHFRVRGEQKSKATITPNRPSSDLHFWSYYLTS